MKYLQALLMTCVLTPAAGFAEYNCEVKYTFGNTGSWGFGVDYSWMEDYEIYNGCRTFCFEYNRKENAASVECHLNGVDIESSEYKQIYMTTKHQFCTISMESIKNGEVGTRLELAPSEEECQKKMNAVYFCRDGSHKCSFVYGG